MSKTLLIAALALLCGGFLAVPALAAPARPAGPPRTPAAMAPPARTPASMGTPPGTPPTRPAAGTTGADDEDPPADADPVPPDQRPYRSIQLEAHGITWLEPGQAGLIEAHPLVMGLAAMALATVTLLFFFLRGVKRPRNEDL